MTKARDLSNIISSGSISNDYISLDAAEIPNLDTAKITTGSFDTARIPSLDAAKITSGTFAADRIDNNSLSNVTALPFSAGTDWQSTIVTGTTLTAVAGKGYWIDTTSNACTITLPASASVGDFIEFSDYARTWGTNGITLNTNGLNFQGATTTGLGAYPLYNTDGQSVKIIYSGATKGWIPTVDDDVTYETTQEYNIEYLVIAGGGSGGGGHRGGGGGAGGYRNSYASETSGRNSSTETPFAITPGKVLTVTVGAGGAMPYNGTAAINGNPGSSSSISGSGITTITSYGGGGGGGYTLSATAGTYGSGAGAGHESSNPTSGSDGSAGQGFDGGDTVSSLNQQGGAGGGAGANGANGGTTSATSGGTGLASLITGLSVTRAGGGGAGSYGTGGYSTGGAGGGGNGGSTNASDPHSGVPDGDSYYYPTSGTANTGGGGGGMAGPNSDGTSYGSGGSGVVILRMLASKYSGTTTGSPTVDDDGSYKVLTFNSSGSYTT